MYAPLFQSFPGTNNALKVKFLVQGKKMEEDNVKLFQMTLGQECNLVCQTI